MPEFTALICLEHKPHVGFVIRRGQYVEIKQTTSYTPSQLSQMLTFYLPQRKYTYMYYNGREFHSLDEISDFVNH